MGCVGVQSGESAKYCSASQSVSVHRVVWGRSGARRAREPIARCKRADNAGVIEQEARSSEGHQSNHPNHDTDCSGPKRDVASYAQLRHPTRREWLASSASVVAAALLQDAPADAAIIDAREVRRMSGGKVSCHFELISVLCLPIGRESGPIMTLAVHVAGFGCVCSTAAGQLQCRTACRGRCVECSE